jgi:hypothetical protein
MGHLTPTRPIARRAVRPRPSGVKKDGEWTSKDVPFTQTHREWMSMPIPMSTVAILCSPVVEVDLGCVL